MDGLVLFKAAEHADPSALPIVANPATGQPEHERFAVMVRDVCRRTLRERFNSNTAYTNHAALVKKTSGTFVKTLLFRARRNDETKRALVVKVKRVPEDAKHRDAEFVTNMFEKHFLDLLCGSGHPNIVRFYNAWAYEKTREVFIEMEDAGDPLTATMEQHGGRVPEPLMAWYMWQALCGLAYIHSQSVIHCDIKSDNLMVKPAGLLRITDFGMSQECGTPFNAVDWRPDLINPHGYKPYELLVPDDGQHGAGPVNAAVDVYALGCVYVSGLMGAPCRFDTVEVSGQLEHMAQFSAGMPSVPQPVPGLAFFNGLAPQPSLKNLLDRMLHWDSRRRIIAAAASHHPYFATVHPPRNMSK